MSRHESGTVRVIPATDMHHFHQVNRYGDVSPADQQLPRRSNSMARVVVMVVAEIPEPGRHRYDDSTPGSATAVYRLPNCDPTNGGKWECPRVWSHMIAVEFEYL